MALITFLFALVQVQFIAGQFHGSDALAAHVRFREG